MLLRNCSCIAITFVLICTGEIVIVYRKPISRPAAAPGANGVRLPRPPGAKKKPKEKP